MRRTYEVNANGNRSYTSTRKADVMGMYRTWRRQGHQPQAYAISVDAEGRVVCDRIA